ncbi:ATP-binding cassette [Lithospermum erythrorhizon]|uniref:ATP-binding cassette n=1 Tax=Lithospermum erythrorhizon TaxID=34254 RepID=A0AAV3QM48_LITER
MSERPKEIGRENDESKEDDNTKNKKNEKVGFYKLFTFADRLDLTLMMVGTIAAVANGMTQPVMTLIFGNLINTLGTTPPSRVVHEVSKVSLLFLYLAIGSGMASLLQMSCWMVTGERQAGRIRGLYLKTILKQDIAFFDTETTTGEVIGRMSGDTVLIQDAMGEKVGKCIQLTSTFVGGFAIAFVKGWRLTLVLISCLPAIVASGVCMSLIMSKASSNAQIAYARASNVVEQSIGSIRTVASFTGEKRALDKYCAKLKDAYTCAVHQGFASGFGLGSMLLIVFCTYGLAVWYGGKLIMGKGYNGGDVINVIMAIMTGGISLGQTSPSLSAFAAGKAAAYKMFKTISRKPSINSSNTSGVVLGEMKGDIELKDVHFRYPARPDVQIFAGFSLQVPSGKTVALVGQSGSGKSTVISLLERFYDPDSGEILIDNINIKRFQLKWLRDNMGLVSQEPVLFATSIKENILYGKKNASDSEVRNAIELANAAKFIDNLPNGLDTMVGEHGTHLSGGQKQRIAISRAILKNPKILLLDEATSALDAESERVVQDALENVMTNRTTVVVAHHLSTIRNADLIAVVNQGKLIEQGTHSQLIRDEDGAYSQLIHMQEGKNAVEDSYGVDSKKVEPSLSSEYEIIRSSSQRLSERRSSSNRSARHSFSVNDSGVPEEDDVEKGLRQSSKKVSLSRLAILNKPELPFLLLGSVAACVNGVIFPIFGLLLSKAIRIFYEPFSELKKDSRFWALMYVALGVVSLCVIPVQNGLFGIAGGRLIRRIRSLSFEKVVNQDISWFDDPANSSGAVGARLSTDASTVRSLVGDALALIVQNVATVIAGLVIAFTANWILAIIILLVLPFFGLQGYLQMKFLHGFSADAKASSFILFNALFVEELHSN